ncbi:MAG: hypothetical protein ACLUFV_11365 [Acutalibacteraceae bacterium]
MDGGRRLSEKPLDSKHPHKNIFPPFSKAWMSGEGLRLAAPIPHFGLRSLFPKRAQKNAALISRQSVELKLCESFRLPARFPVACRRPHGRRLFTGGARRFLRLLRIS